MTAPQNTAATRAGGNFRRDICTLLFFSVALNHIDRNIIGILKPHLGEKLGRGENDHGTIAAGFSFAYVFSYLLGGFGTYFTGGLVSKATGWILQTTRSYAYVFAWASLMHVPSLIAIPLLPQTLDNA